MRLINISVLLKNKKMKTITFQCQNTNDLMLLMLLAKRMGISTIEEPTNKGKGEKMAIALEKLSQINAFAHISDPVKWQRQIRKDRKLPKR